MCFFLSNEGTYVKIPRVREVALSAVHFSSAEIGGTRPRWQVCTNVVYHAVLPDAAHRQPKREPMAKRSQLPPHRPRSRRRIRRISSSSSSSSGSSLGSAICAPSYLLLQLMKT